MPYLNGCLSVLSKQLWLPQCLIMVVVFVSVMVAVHFILSQWVSLWVTVDDVQPPKVASHWELPDQTLRKMPTPATGSTQLVTRVIRATASVPITVAPTLREKSLALVIALMNS